MLHFEMAKAAGDGDPMGVLAGKTLGEIADKRGLSQKQVAAYACLPASTVHNYFKGGTQKPSLTYILKLCTALDVDIKQVLGLSPMPEIKKATPDDRLGRIEARQERTDAVLEEIRKALLETDPRKRAASESRPAPTKSAQDDRRPNTGRPRRASGGA